MNIDSTVSIRVSIKSCFVETIAIVPKLNDQRIKIYRNKSYYNNKPMTVANFSLEATHTFLYNTLKMGLSMFNICLLNVAIVRAMLLGPSPALV